MKKLFLLAIAISPAVEANDNNAIQIHSCESLYTSPPKQSDENISWDSLCGDRDTKENGGVCINRMIGDLMALPYFEDNPDWIARAILDQCIANQTKTTP